jgi:transcriptional regulator with XRE-family HTH domain
MNDLGSRLIALRKKEGLTQMELAQKIDISHTQVTRYENKGVQPPADVLRKIADVFGVSIDYLVNGTAEEKAQTALTDAELIRQFKEVEQLPDNEKKTILNVLAAYTRDFKAKQAYLI